MEAANADLETGLDIALEACVEVMEMNLQLSLDLERAHQCVAALEAENANLRQAIAVAARALHQRMVEISIRGVRDPLYYKMIAVDNWLRALYGIPPVYQ